MDRNELLRLLRERIFHFAASRLQRDQAEDLTQETMLVLHEKYAALESDEDLLPVAFQVLRYKMASSLRKMARRGEDTVQTIDDLPLASPGENPERAAARRELETRLTAALRALGERCRELFRLKLDGFSFEEIRRQMGADAINTVYTWDHRCRQQLKERLGASWGATP